MKIQHDFHIHTALSVCAAETAAAESYLASAEKFGLKKLGFSNHFWDSSVSGANEFYAPQDLAHLKKLKPEIEAVSWGDIQPFFGCEAEYDPFHHGIAVTEAAAEQFDYILVPNSHTHMMMPKKYYYPYQKHIDFMVQAYEEILSCRVSRYITAIAHPFEAVACPYDNEMLISMIPDDTLKRLFSKTADKGIAVEINVASLMNKSQEEIERCPQLHMFQLAKECGCKFLFGSDAHSKEEHAAFANADTVAELLKLSKTDLAEIAL